MKLKPCFTKTKINCKSIKKLESVKFLEENFKTLDLALYVQQKKQSTV